MPAELHTIIQSDPKYPQKFAITLSYIDQFTLSCAQNPLDTFPRDFPIDGEVANLLRTCYWETGVMDFGLYTQR